MPKQVNRNSSSTINAVNDASHNAASTMVFIYKNATSAAETPYLAHNVDLNCRIMDTKIHPDDRPKPPANFHRLKSLDHLWMCFAIRGR